MGAITIFDGDAEAFRTPAEAYPPEAVARIPDPEQTGTRVRFHHPGGPDDLQLFELEIDPGLALAPHAHAADEIIAVLQGSLIVGKRVLNPGSSLLVRGDTLYTVRAGPDGCRFLNFRAASDTTYFTKADLARKRAERAPDASSP